MSDDRITTHRRWDSVIQSLADSELVAVDDGATHRELYHLTLDLLHTVTRERDVARAMVRALRAERSDSMRRAA